MGQVCLEEAQRLVKMGHEVAVFALRYSGTKYQDQNFPFKVARLWTPLKYGDAGFAPQLLFKLKNFDIVHLHYPFYGSAQCVLAAKKLFGQKYVVTYHMDASPGGLKRIVQKIYDFIWPRFILRGAAKVLAVDSDHFKSTAFGHLVNPEKLIELPNAVDHNIFYPRQTALAEQYKNKQVLLFVANPMPVKRLDLALTALKILNNPGVVLVVVGGGYKIERYKKLAEELKINQQVVWVEKSASLPELAEYFNLATALLVPSDKESFSLVALMAQACGKPVVASDIPGLRRRVNNGVDGFLFKSGSAQDLAEKINKVLSLSETERKAMGEAGRQKSLNYSWEEHVRKLEQIYRSAM